MTSLRRKADDLVAFQYPHIAIGDRVEVSNDPSRGDRVFGTVVAAKNGCADIYFITSDDFGMKRSCWHEGDPRCVEHPEHFEGNVSGVFSLCESELRIREMLRRLDALDNSQAVLAGNVARLTETQPDRNETRESTPRRGRPRKQRELVSETA